MSQRKRQHRQPNDDHPPARRRRHRPTAAELRAQRQAAQEEREEKSRDLAEDNQLYAQNLPGISRLIADEPPADAPEEMPQNPLLVPSTITSGFGGRPAIATSKGRSSTNHWGCDIVPLVRTDQPVPVFSATKGKVIFAGKYDNKIGEVVMIQSADGTIYTYGHLEWGSSMRVQIGQEVEPGKTMLGIMGSSGNVSGKCVHFTVRVQPTTKYIQERLLGTGRSSAGFDIRAFVADELAAQHTVTADSLLAAMQLRDPTATRDSMMASLNQLSRQEDRTQPIRLAMQMNSYIAGELLEGRGISTETMLSAMRRNLYEHQPIEPIINGLVASKGRDLPGIGLPSSVIREMATVSPADPVSPNRTTGVVPASSASMPIPTGTQQLLDEYRAYQASRQSTGPVPTDTLMPTPSTIPEAGEAVSPPPPMPAASTGQQTQPQGKKAEGTRGSR